MDEDDFLDLLSLPGNSRFEVSNITSALGAREPRVWVLVSLDRY